MVNHGNLIDFVNNLTIHHKLAKVLEPLVSVLDKLILFFGSQGHLICYAFLQP
jgi:hypothetical protein